MHDIKWIREHPELFDAAMRKRGADATADEVLVLDNTKRQLQTEIQNLQHQRKELAKTIGIAKSKGEDADSLQAQAKEVNQALDKLQANLEGEDPLEALLMRLPNIPDEDVPEGKDESANIEQRKWGTIPEFDFIPKQHFELGEMLGMMDFEQTAKISGSRFVTLSGELAHMERALANFMLDVHIREFGFKEYMPPSLVRDPAMLGVGQLPKFDLDSFKTTNDYRLIPTAEVSLVSQVMDSILETDQLPIRMASYTQCYRSEAGSAGKDTRGMIRNHQFSKVELVSVTTQEQSEAEHELITSAASSILEKLELPYRVMLLSTGDAGFSASKTYDLEVWLPGQNAYREISSCSNCKAFQARRMKARHRKAGEKQTHFVHTLNGSGLAIGRTIVAILENYQQKDGSIRIPKALQPYMGDKETIAKDAS